MVQKESQMEMERQKIEHTFFEMRGSTLTLFKKEHVVDMKDAIKG